MSKNRPKIFFIIFGLACVIFLKSASFAIGGSTPPPDISVAPVPPGGSGDLKCGGSGINTAIGCISFEDANSLTESLLRLGIGVGGGIAFILLVYAAFLIITSSGDPKKLSAGKELLVAALSGLLLLIFSAFLLRFVGQDLLKLPGF